MWQYRKHLLHRFSSQVWWQNAIRHEVRAIRSVHFFVGADNSSVGADEMRRWLVHSHQGPCLKLCPLPRKPRALWKAKGTRAQYAELHGLWLQKEEEISEFVRTLEEFHHDKLTRMTVYHDGPSPALSLCCSTCVLHVRFSELYFDDYQFHFRQDE